MSEQDLKRLKDVARNRLKRQYTRDESMHTFVMAGILKWDGTYTENYPNLAAWEADKKSK